MTQSALMVHRDQNSGMRQMVHIPESFRMAQNFLGQILLNQCSDLPCCGESEGFEQIEKDPDFNFSWPQKYETFENTAKVGLQVLER